MKNILVLLVTVGIGYAYWYQLPDAPVIPAAKPAVVVAPPKPAFAAARTALDEPAVSTHSGAKHSSVLLGSENPGQTH